MDSLVETNFYQHTKCPYFPCHSNINPKDFNCKFCYCPLYLVPKCGGNYTILKNGIKDCSKCTIVHQRNAFDHIFKILIKLYKE